MVDKAFAASREYPGCQPIVDRLAILPLRNEIERTHLGKVLRQSCLPRANLLARSSTARSPSITLQSALSRSRLAEP